MPYLACPGDELSTPFFYASINRENSAFPILDFATHRAAMQSIDKALHQLEAHLNEKHLDSAVFLLSDLNPNDIGYLLRHLRAEQRGQLYQLLINFEYLATVVQESTLPIAIELLSVLREQDTSLAQKVITQINANDRAKVLSAAPVDLADWLRSLTTPGELQRTEALLKYPEFSAGRIMSSGFVSTTADTSIDEVWRQLKAAETSEMIYYIFVVDAQQHLIGVLSLRDMLHCAPNQAVSDKMNTDVKFARIDTDQEEVVHLVERYNLSAIPVLSAQDELVGIITVDDIIDIIRYEATEDILFLAGTNKSEYELSAPHKSFISRVPWLLAAFLGGVATVQSMNLLLDFIPYTVLLAFVPVISGMGGNIGTQASAIIVRGLATGNIRPSRVWQVLWREMMTGVLLGSFFGGILFCFAQAQFHEVPLIGIMVGVGIFVSIFMAACLGALLPIFFQTLKIDPAIASGPIVSTLIDNIGLLGYLTSILSIHALFL